MTNPASSSNSRVGLNRRRAFGGPGYHPCHCKIPATLRTSWSRDNPGRKFYNCPMSLISTKACDYFDWVDPELPPEFDCYKKEMFDLKEKLRLRADYVQVAKLEEKLSKLKFKRSLEKEKLEAMAVEVGMLKAEGERARKQLFWTRAVVLAAVIFFIAWITNAN